MENEIDLTEKMNAKVAGVIAMISLLASLIIFLTISDEVKVMFVRLFILHLVLSLVLWFFCKKALNKIRKDDKNRLFNLKIFTIYLVVIFVGTYLITFISFYIFTMIMQCSVPFTVYLKSALPIVLIVFIGNLLVDLVKMSKQKKTIQDQAEMLRVLHNKAAISNLRMQTDSHFVYNFLHVLPDFFGKGSDVGSLLVTNFTKIYRYSLETFREDWVDLQKEIKVAESFVQLQQISFPNSIQIKYELDEIDLMAYMIPPFALQMVVENAIKHNIHSIDNPLLIVIRLCENGKCIEISNLISPLVNPLKSTGVGLQNLKERYELLMNATIEYFSSDNKFIVKLPIVPIL